MCEPSAGAVIAVSEAAEDITRISGKYFSSFTLPVGPLSGNGKESFIVPRLPFKMFNGSQWKVFNDPKSRFTIT